MPTAFCSGCKTTVSGTAQQFGLAMMPSLSRMSSRFTSGTTSGTFSFMRQAELLSITRAPASAATGAYIRAISVLAAKSATSMPLNALFDRLDGYRAPVVGHLQTLRAHGRQCSDACARKVALGED